MSTKWSYGQQDSWLTFGAECAPNEPGQTPINIDTSIITKCSGLCKLEFSYRPSKCRLKYITGQNLTITYDSGSGVLFNNTYYKLKDITIHTPSLHKIDNESCDMEICLQHQLTDESGDFKGIIVSILLNSGHSYGNEEIFFNQFINEIIEGTEVPVDVSSSWNINMVIPKKKSFYVYEGSLYYPECKSNTIVVMDTIGNIGQSNLQFLKSVLGNNVRAIQLLGNRDIFYNSGVNLTLKREEYITENKYLRCLKKKETFSAPKEVPNDSNNEMSHTTKKWIKLIFLILNLVTLMIIAYNFTKLLFKSEIAFHFIIAIVGLDNYGQYTNNEELIKIWKESSKCSNI